MVRMPCCSRQRRRFSASNKAFASSSPTRHGHTWSDQRTPSIRLKIMAWSSGFLRVRQSSTSVKQGDLCRRGSKSTTGIYIYIYIYIYDSPVPRPPPFLNTPTRPATIQFGTRLILLIETLTGTHVGSRKLST